MALTQADYAAIRSLIQAYATAPPAPTSGLLRPGTVTTYDQGTQQTGVVVDGDLAPTMTLNITGFHLPVGQRVMVSFQPPHGAFVVGLAQPTDPLIVPGGSAANPGVVFLGGDPGMGLFMDGTTFGLANAGERFYMTSTGRLRMTQLGSESTPAFSWAYGNSGTGFGLLSSTVLSISADGTYVAHFRSTAATTTVVFPNHATTTGTANVLMAASGNLYRLTSTREIKRDVEEVTDSGLIIERLRPVSYRLKPEHATEDADPEQVYLGFIAEDVAEADERLGQYDEDGNPVYYDSNGLLAVLVAEVQALRRRVESLEAEVADLREGCCS